MGKADEIDINTLEGPLGLRNFYCIEVGILPQRSHDKISLAYSGSWNRGCWKAPREAVQEYFFPWLPSRMFLPQSKCRPDSFNLNSVIENSSASQSIVFGAGL
jgi:hypothetical protein